MVKINISKIVVQAAISGVCSVFVLLWCIDSPFAKYPCMIIPTIFLFIAFIIIFFEPDFLCPEYSIFQSVINALLYIGSYCIVLVGEYSPTASLPPQYTFPAKNFLALSIPFYYYRIINYYSLNFVPFGAIIGSLLGSYSYVILSNIPIYLAVVALTQILFNVFIFPPKLVQYRMAHKKTE